MKQQKYQNKSEKQPYTKSRTSVISHMLLPNSSNMEQIITLMFMLASTNRKMHFHLRPWTSSLQFSQNATDNKTLQGTKNLSLEKIRTQIDKIDTHWT